MTTDRKANIAIRGTWCLAAVFGALAGPVSAQAAPARPPVMGFYVPWDPASLVSLKANGDALTWIVPGWIFVSGPDHRITDQTDAAIRDAIKALPNRPKLLPMVQNALGGKWYGPDTVRLLHDRKARALLLDRMMKVLAAEKADGMFVDLEELPASAQLDLMAFLGEAKAAFGRRAWEIAIAAPVGNDDWNLKALSGVVDHVLLMAYDQHSEDSAPGPIAATPWFREVVAAALAEMPADKAIVGIASYAYDWVEGGPTRALSIAAAQALAAAHVTTPTLDMASGNSHFTYVERGKRHQVWMMTESAVAAQADAAVALGASAIGLWRLGTEDPGVWPHLRGR